MSARFQTPVVLIVFRRPEATARVFEAIRQARPAALLVVADGPRRNRPGEAELCSATRAIFNRVDWNCSVLTNYANQNLGLKQRVESGLDWAFSQIEEAIILEDDTLPHPTFFPFCAALLERYRRDERIMAVAGSSFLFGRHRTPFSYHFSRYPLIWGWATWRRAWRHHDPTMREWPALRGTGSLGDVLETPAAVRYWSYCFQRNFETMGSWDYAWTLSCWRRGALSVTPNVNMVTNIGFGADGSHTMDAASKFAGMEALPVEFPLRHPERVERDKRADALTEETAFSGEHFLRPMFRAARAFLRSRHGA